MSSLIIILLIFIILFLYLRYINIEKYGNYLDVLNKNSDTSGKFCEKLKLLDTPNENNILQRKFLDETINDNDNKIKELENNIEKIYRDNNKNFIKKKNMFRLRKHNDSVNQIDAINHAKKNINSNNKVILNIT